MGASYLDNFFTKRWKCITIKCCDGHFTDETMLCEDAGPRKGGRGRGSGDSTAPVPGEPRTQRGCMSRSSARKGGRAPRSHRRGGAEQRRTGKRQGTSAAPAAIQHLQTRSRPRAGTGVCKENSKARNENKCLHFFVAGLARASTVT